VSTIYAVIDYRVVLLCEHDNKYNKAVSSMYTGGDGKTVMFMFSKGYVK